MSEAPVRLALQSLTLTNFRCYERLQLKSLSPRVQVLTGPNGAGKTNILEALSFFIPGRGLRGPKLSEIDRKVKGEDARPWGIHADIETAVGTIDVSTGKDVAAALNGRDRRIVKIKGDETTQSALAEYFSVIWLTPAMDRLFLDAASDRRRFYDRLVYGVMVNHAHDLKQFEKALKDRNALLKNAAETSVDPSWFDAIEKSLATSAIKVVENRKTYLDFLNIELKKDQSTFPKVLMEFDSAWENENSDAEKYLQQLKDQRSRDIMIGSTQAGPHKMDLKILNLDKGLLAPQCSTGEQKAMLLSLVLAGTHLTRQKRGLTPLILLDEIVAHLDENRRQELYKKIIDFDAQVWLTGTDSAIFSSLKNKADFYHVEAAKIEKS